MVAAPTSRALWGSGAGCFSGVGIYLPGTVGQGCMHCRASVQAVSAVSEPTSQALWGRGAGCLSGLRTYLLGTVGQGCSLLNKCQNLPPGHRGVDCLCGVPTYLLGAGVQVV